MRTSAPRAFVDEKHLETWRFLSRFASRADPRRTPRMRHAASVRASSGDVAPIDGEKKSPKLLTHKKTVIRFRPSSDTCESEWRNQTRQRAPQNGPPPGQPNRWTQGSFPSRKHPTHSRAARSAAGGPGFFASAHRVHRRQELSISAGARACRRRFRCIGSRVHRPVAGLFPRRCLELGNTPIDH